MDPLEQELQAVVISHEYWKINSGLQIEQQVLLSIESSLQPLFANLWMYFQCFSDIEQIFCADMLGVCCFSQQ